MGQCTSSDPHAKARNQEITKYLEQSKVRDLKEIKLLLLGAGESGKSTVLKQMRILNNDSLSLREHLAFRNVIRTNVVSSAATLIEVVERLQIPWGSAENAERARRIISLLQQPPDTSPTLSDPSQTLSAPPPTAPTDFLTPDLGADIAQVWSDTAIQTAWAQRSQFQIQDSAGYFFGEIERVAHDDFSPTVQDVLRCRLKTLSVVETALMIEGHKFRIVDVGGQRNERRKWIHCFDNVSAVIFVVAISEYDQVLAEDAEMNRMLESLLLFEDTCNSKYFANTPFMIFFNKMDLFEEKIKRVDMKVCFPDYKGGCDADAAKKYLQMRFDRANKNPARNLYHHFTTATDSTLMRVVLDATRHILITDMLRTAQLL